MYNLASIHDDVGLVVGDGELLLVVSLKPDGAGVACGGRVVPGRGVEAGVGEVLVGLAAHQAQEGQLD